MDSESSSLHFIRLLLEAWESEDRKESLAEALREIARLGAKSTHNEDHANFLRFMDEVEDQLLAEPEATRAHFLEAVRLLLPDLVADTWEGTTEEKEAILRLCEAHPDLKAELDQMRSELKPLLGLRGSLQLELRRGPETEAVIPVPIGVKTISVPNIFPGAYTLTLSTGRLIWEGMILPEQVLWAEAYPGRDLEMAAQTGDLGQEATHVESLLNGELELRMYPGLEAGTMRIARSDRRLGAGKRHDGIQRDRTHGSGAHEGPAGVWDDPRCPRVGGDGQRAGGRLR